VQEVHERKSIRVGSVFSGIRISITLILHLTAPFLAEAGAAMSAFDLEVPDETFIDCSPFSGMNYTRIRPQRTRHIWLSTFGCIGAVKQILLLLATKYM